MRSLLAVLALLLLSGAGAAGDSAIVRTYEMGSLNARASLGDPLGLTQDGSIDLGGVYIPGRLFPPGSALRDVVVADAVAERVRALACQDLDLDAVCGEADAEEARVEFCDSLAQPANVLATNGLAFASGAPLIVFVFATPVRISLASPGTNGPAFCPDGAANAATTGTVTILLDP